MDSGAKLTVISYKQALLYCDSVNKQLERSKSTHVYRLGEKTHQSLGKLVVQMPLSSTHLHM